MKAITLTIRVPVLAVSCLVRVRVRIRLRVKVKVRVRVRVRTSFERRFGDRTRVNGICDFKKVPPDKLYRSAKRD